MTQEFNQYNSGIGSRGKLGYNGWTSPYYKSRMYYQFRWPKLNDEPVPGNRINSAEFSYVQTHSPQHDCSNTTFGPSVKLQFHNTINSSTTWSNQPGIHTGSGSKTSDYAVGSESVCGKTYTQKWNVSAMVTAERAANPTRTTVTVGLRSSDEGDKNGWREYKHSEGSSPKLTIVYQANPSTPAVPTISSVVSGYVTSLTPTLSTTVALPTGSTCIQTNCLRADFEVWGPNDSLVASMTSAAAASGASVSVTVPTGKLVDHTTYRVRVKARSVDHGGSSVWAQTTMTTRLNTAPPPGTAVAPIHATGAVATGANPSIATRTPRLRATMPSGAVCASGTSCLTATFTISGPSSWSQTLAGRAPGVTAEVAVPTGSQLVLGKHTLTVKVCKEWAPTACSTASSEFTVVELPKPTIVGDPVVDGSKITLVVTTAGAGVTGYLWSAAFGDPAETVSGTISTQCVTNCPLTFTVPETWSGTALVTVRALGGTGSNPYPGVISNTVPATVNQWG